MKDMPNTAQTRSTEQDVGVLNHEKEEHNGYNITPTGYQ